MLTGRAFAVLGAGAALYVASRLVGSPDLHMVALGLLALVPAAAFLVRVNRQRVTSLRRLSTRRTFPGGRVRVELEIHGDGRSRAPFLLLEDRVPPGLGPPARAVAGDLPPGGRRVISYDLVPRARGRYPIGPLRVLVSDPFDLIRHVVPFRERQDLVVYPEVEDLGGARQAAPAGSSGDSSSRQLFRSGEDFYTMRRYEVGDDLRLIHWPSVARTGDLMIRQDEAARRASAVLFLDTREEALGSWPEAFERAVSAAASIGVHHLRAGYRVRLATPEQPPRYLDRDQMLDLLAVLQPSRVTSLSPGLRRLRDASSGGAALLVVTRVPSPAEVAELSRAGSGYGPKLAVLIHRVNPDDLHLEARHNLDRETELARRSLGRAGWDVILLPPNGRLHDAWTLRTKRPAIAASW
ncbi:MAG: DUF58 domain-containing protein [Actinomycetota bacterium]